MPEERPDRSDRQRNGEEPGRLPPLIRFLGLHLILGAAVGVAFVSLLVLMNFAGLKELIADTENPYVALLLIYSFNVVTFGSVTMGVGIMIMPHD